MQMFKRLSLTGGTTGTILLAVCLLFGGVSPARADHALLQDGSGLFNVVVEDTNTTWSRPLRVRIKTESFQYDYESNSVKPLLGHTAYFQISEFQRSTDTLGKFGARHFMESKRWHRFIPPPALVIVPFTPAPPPTPMPKAVATPDPGRLAETTLPLEKRVEKQLAMFIDEQSRLSNRIRFSQSIHTVDEATGRQHRMALLKEQLGILTRAYPMSASIVQKAKEALEHQIELVKESGRFSFED